MFYVKDTGSKYVFNSGSKSHFEEAEKLINKLEGLIKTEEDSDVRNF